MGRGGLLGLLCVWEVSSGVLGGEVARAARLDWVDEDKLVRIVIGVR